MFRFVVHLCFVLVLPGLILSSYALILAIDHTDVIQVGTYSGYLNQGFTRVIPRIYNSACSTGGEVNPSFVASYNNARSAGITDIQGYVLLCNGSNNTACKSYQDQINEIMAVISSNKMIIGKLWFDLEQDDDCPGNWNYGPSGNQAQAQSLLAAIIASSLFDFGFYSFPDAWNDIFGSTGFVLNSTAPLWYSDHNDNATVALDAQFGGWTTAAGHQYNYDANDGTVAVDKSIFAS